MDRDTLRKRIITELETWRRGFDSSDTIADCILEDVDAYAAAQFRAGATDALSASLKTR